MAIRNSFYIATMFFLCACSSSKWQTDSIQCSSEKYSSKKLTYHDDQLAAPIFEIIQVKDNLYGSLKAVSGHFTSDQFSLTIRDGKYECHGKLHEGGQKISLFPSTIEMIINALKNGSAVHVQMDNFETVIDAKNFSVNYDKISRKGFSQKIVDSLQNAFK